MYDFRKLTVIEGMGITGYAILFTVLVLAQADVITAKLTLVLVAGYVMPGLVYTALGLRPLRD